MWGNTHRGADLPIAGRGPLGPDAFHCVFADGVAPPFAAQSFDTLVTPWFIDQVPRDLPAFIRMLGELLRPGGRWLNQGPLVYPAQTPFERRYAREELFELVRAAGFTLGDWSRASHRYLDERREAGDARPNAPVGREADERHAPSALSPARRAVSRAACGRDGPARPSRGRPPAPACRG